MKRRLWLYPLAIVAVGVILGYTAEWWSKNDLLRARARARAVGLAVTAEDMRGPVVEPDHNAAEFYRYALEMTKVMEAGARHTVDAYLPYNPRSQVITAAALELQPQSSRKDTLSALKPILRQLDEGTAQKKLNWNRDWKLGVNVLFPEYAAMKRFTRALMFDADDALRHNDAKRALRRFEQVRIIVHHAYEEPTYIGVMVGISCLKIAYSQSVYLSRANNEEFNKGILKFLAKADPPDMRNALRGEAFMWTDFIPRFALKAESPGPENMAGTWSHRFMKSGFVQRGMQVRMLDHIREAALAMPKDPNDYEKVREAFNAMDKAFDDDKSFIGNITRAYWSPDTNVSSRIVDLEAYRRLAVVRTQLSIRYQGNWPANLPADLAGIQDPWSKKPFIYARRGDGIALYSVGLNLIDDGGISTGLDVISLP